MSIFNCCKLYFLVMVNSFKSVHSPGLLSMTFLDYLDRAWDYLK